jgi:glucose-1-phosphate adenylyltransferase
MGVNYSVLGLIFASMHDSSVIELTKQRTMGSILFGGRYRLIDFPLSNMVNSGVYEVGVITKSNYSSLLDHLGSGREWDLSRKKGGLHLLPPYSQVGGIYRGRLEALNNIWSFVENSKAKYVILSDCDFVTAIDFNPALEQHIKTEADITAIYSRSIYDNEKTRYTNVLEFDENGRVSEVLIEPQFSGECNISLDMFIISKEFLKKIVKEAASKNQYSLITEIQAKKDEYKIYGYEHKNYFTKIDSVQSYYEANLALLNTENRDKLFTTDLPIYTKIRDTAPVKYGLESNIKNSLIADGCVIEGTVENCVLFRGVKIGKGTVVKNSVLLQGTELGERCKMNSIITDKNVKISNEKVLTGSETYPLYIGKNASI